MAPPQEHGQLVSDWVEVFAPVIWAAYAPVRWPQWVLIDDTSFRVSRPDRSRGEEAFTVLGAVGYGPNERPQVVALEAVPTLDIPTWKAFLRSLKGTPTVVVGDGGLPLTAAERTWGRRRPAPQLRRCQWHLMRNLTRSLPAEVQRDPTDPVHQLITGALRDVQGWRRLQQEIAVRSAAGGYLSALKTVLALEPVVHRQLQHDGPGPRSVGPLEQFFRELSATLGPRAGRLTNKVRADALLTLLAADRNGWTDESAWAELIRNHLLSQQGLPRQQRQHTDPGHTPSLRRLPSPRPIDV